MLQYAAPRHRRAYAKRSQALTRTRSVTNECTLPEPGSRSDKAQPAAALQMRTDMRVRHRRPEVKNRSYLRRNDTLRARYKTTRAAPAAAAVAAIEGGGELKTARSVIKWPSSMRGAAAVFIWTSGGGTNLRQTRKCACPTASVIAYNCYARREERHVARYRGVPSRPSVNGMARRCWSSLPPMRGVYSGVVRRSARYDATRYSAGAWCVCAKI